MSRGSVRYTLHLLERNALILVDFVNINFRDKCENPSITATADDDEVWNHSEGMKDEVWLDFRNLFKCNIRRARRNGQINQKEAAPGPSRTPDIEAMRLPACWLSVPALRW